MLEDCPTGVIACELLNLELVDDDLKVSGGKVENNHALLCLERARAWSLASRATI